MVKTVRIVGVGATKVGRLAGQTAFSLATEAFDLALNDACLTKRDVEGFLAVPSLSDPRLMQGHHLATKMGLLPSTRLVVRTIDTGGAGPITAIGTAANMIRQEWAQVVAIIASDAVLSLPSREFHRRADEAVHESGLGTPMIPMGYDRVAQWYMQRYKVRREQLAMVTVLMSYFASRHPHAMCRRQYTLDEVLSARSVAPVTSVLECARRADGAVALILASSTHYKRNFGKSISQCPVVISSGEGSGPLYPPEIITPHMFSCERACRDAYDVAQLGVRDIDFFGLYDCFPICFLRALEAVHFCKEGEGASVVEDMYRRLLQQGKLDPHEFPFNLHGA